MACPRSFARYTLSEGFWPWPRALCGPFSPLIRGSALLSSRTALKKKKGKGYEVLHKIPVS